MLEKILDWVKAIYCVLTSGLPPDQIRTAIQHRKALIKESNQIRKLHEK